MSTKQTYTYRHPHPAVTTDCVVFGYDMNGGLSVLLIQRGAAPYRGRWAIPGGFLEMNEDAMSCARRELMEETGLEISSLEEIGSFSEVDRDPRERVVSIAFFTLSCTRPVKGSDDAAQARWFPVKEVPPLAFDHGKILEKALSCLRERFHRCPVGLDILPETFTISELKDLYEAILEKKLDTRSFKATILKQGLLREMEGNPNDSGKFFSTQYRFNRDRYHDLESRGGFRLQFKSGREWI